MSSFNQKLNEQPESELTEIVPVQFNTMQQSSAYGNPLQALKSRNAGYQNANDFGGHSSNYRN